MFVNNFIKIYFFHLCCLRLFRSNVINYTPVTKVYATLYLKKKFSDFCNPTYIEFLPIIYRVKLIYLSPTNKLFLPREITIE